MPNLNDDLKKAKEKTGNGLNFLYNFIREPINAKQAVKRGTIALLVLFGLGWGCFEWEKAAAHRRWCRTVSQESLRFYYREGIDHPCQPDY